MLILSFLIVVATVKAATEGINFLAIGDWGGSGSSPYTTTAQVAAAAGMDVIAKQINSEFVVALGDNFYSNGIPTDENDPRFTETFDSVYKGAYLQTPWYVTAGNHDHKGNVTAQIEYSKHNTRWTFPSEFYTQSFTSSDGVTMDLIMIDTIDVAGSISAYSMEEGHSDYFKPLPERTRASSEKAWTWLEDQMKASTAMYLLVGGHYPVYSLCEHGNTATLVTNLKPLLETYGGHFMSGHDHCMEHIQETTSKVNYFITGMGHDCCYAPSNAASVPTGATRWYTASDNAATTTTGGFSSFSLTKTGMTVTYYDQSGKVLYMTPSVPPRHA